MKLSDDSPVREKKTRLAGKRPPAPLEELVFHGSATHTLGVELEFQVLDRESGDLAPGATRILPACKEQKIDGVSAELLQSMIEVKTDVCNNVSETRAQLLSRIKHVRNIASSLGYDLSMGGTHPFARTTSSTIFPAERYESIKERMGWLTYQIVVYGLHVHVGVPSGDMAIGITNFLVQYLPHLLALSANSPYWQGVDTNLASTRSVLFRLSPNVGVPHYFAKWDDFANYVEVMRACRAIRNTKDIHWDIRPRPQTGTIEFRVCDMPGSLADTFAIVALIRALVVAAQRTLEDKPKLRRGDLRTYWVVPENKWLAARYGLEAHCIRSPGSKRKTLARELTGLIERVSPIAQELGDAAHLAPFQTLDQFESGAQRQRRIYRETGNWKSVVDDMKGRFDAEVNGAQ